MYVESYEGEERVKGDRFVASRLGTLPMTLENRADIGHHISRTKSTAADCRDLYQVISAPFWGGATHAAPSGDVLIQVLVIGMNNDVI
jgi:hypothetical protein